jgi:hypothetical protein
MPVGYRGVFHLEQQEDIFKLATAEFQKWILGKGFDVRSDFLTGISLENNNGDRCGSTGVLSLDESTSGLLLNFSEVKLDRTWRVSIFALRDSSSSDENIFIVEVDVSVKPGDDPVELVAPPRFVRDLLWNSVFSDGGIRLSATPKLVANKEDVDEMMNVISNPNRRVHVNVASAVSSNYTTEWVNLVRKIVSRGIGNSVTYVLTSETSQHFAHAAGEDFGLPSGGSLREFAPGIDVTSPQADMRYNFLNQRTIRKSLTGVPGRFSISTDLQKSFSRTVRNRFAQGELPAMAIYSIPKLEVALSQVRQDFALKNAREAQSKPVIQTGRPIRKEPAFDSNANVLGVAVLDGLKTLISKITNMASSVIAITTEVVSTAIEAYNREKDTFEEILAENAAALGVALTRSSVAENIQVETEIILEETEQRVRELEFQNKLLRRDLYSPNEIESEFEDWQDKPRSLEELIDRLTFSEDSKWHWIGKYIQFTGDTRPLLAIAKHSDSPRFSAKIWLYLEVLYDFAKSRAEHHEANGGIGAYLRNSSGAGSRCDPKNQSSESDSVKSNSRFARQRQFPIPETVDSRGFTEMWDHFKIATADTVSPRMHYYDDTQNSGIIYIGYIGRHLETKNTN